MAGDWNRFSFGKLEKLFSKKISDWDEINQGQIVQNPVMVTQYLWEFWIKFGNLWLGFFVYNVCLLVLSLVLTHHQQTWDIVANTAWDMVAAYVNIYCWIIICPRHWLPACLRRWTEFNFLGKPQFLAIVDNENILCKHHLQMQCTPVRRFDPY